MSATYTPTPTLESLPALTAGTAPTHDAAGSVPPRRARLARMQRGPRAAALALAVSVTLAMLAGIDRMASVDDAASQWARTPSSARA